MRFNILVLALGAMSAVLAHPAHRLRELNMKLVRRDSSVKVIRGEHAAEVAVAVEPIKAAEPGEPGAAATDGNPLDTLASGNQAFRDNLSQSNPGLLKKLTDEGQEPPLMFLGCSDSRVSEGTVFNAKPGTLFTQRNIANQFQRSDANTYSVLSYAVATLGVSHVVVMGHYGCGGVAAAIASPPTGQTDAANGAVQNWIQPIREIFQASTRPEIVELRTKNEKLPLVEEPDVNEPGFRALVEENVKAGVRRIATDSVVTNHFTTLAASGNVTAAGQKRSGEGVIPNNVFIHGFVYDMETGIVRDLGVSVGPPGVPIPAVPFDAITESAEAAGGSVPAAPATANGTFFPASPAAPLQDEANGFSGLNVISQG